MTQIHIIKADDLVQLQEQTNDWLSKKEGSFIGTPSVMLYFYTETKPVALINYRAKTNLSTSNKYVLGQSDNPYLSADGKVQVPKM